jgi:hypothetical protein
MNNDDADFIHLIDWFSNKKIESKSNMKLLIINEKSVSHDSIHLFTLVRKKSYEEMIGIKFRCQIDKSDHCYVRYLHLKKLKIIDYSSLSFII